MHFGSFENILNLVDNVDMVSFGNFVYLEDKDGMVDFTHFQDYWHLNFERIVN